MNNIADITPPHGATNNSTGGNIYDLIGRTIRIGARFNY